MIRPIVTAWKYSHSPVVGIDLLLGKNKCLGLELSFFCYNLILGITWRK